MGSFVEKIAQVKIKDNGEEFAHFYEISKFPVDFYLASLKRVLMR